MDPVSGQEVAMIRDTARRFVRTRLVPLEAQIEAADDVDPALLAALRREAASLGLYGFNLPPRIGGPGLPVEAKLAILEEISYTSVPLNETVGHLPLSLDFCNEEQRRRLLPEILSGAKAVTYALTEPDAGSDLGRIRTRAVRREGGWVLNGRKQFISNAETADYIIVLCVTDSDAPLKRRLTTFIVERLESRRLGHDALQEDGMARLPAERLRAAGLLRSRRRPAGRVGRRVRRDHGVDQPRPHLLGLALARHRAARARDGLRLRQRALGVRRAASASIREYSS